MSALRNSKGILSLLVFGLGCLCQVHLKAAAPTFESLFGDEVLAEGRGFKVLQSEIEEAFIAFQATSAAQGQAIPANQREEVERQLLDRILTVKMLSLKATEEDRKEAQRLTQEFMASAEKEAGSRKAYERQLAATGMTPKVFGAKLLERAVVERVIDRELKSKISVSEEELTKHYRENLESFRVPEAAKVQHLLLSTLDSTTRQPLPDNEKQAKHRTMEGLLARARAGEDFSDLVQRFTEDVASRERKGEYTFTRGNMVPEFEAAAMALPEGGISGIVETQYGYHIIKMLEKTPSRIVEFAEIRERLQAALTERKFQEALPGYVEQQKKSFEVKILKQP